MPACAVRLGGQQAPVGDQGVVVRGLGGHRGSVGRLTGAGRSVISRTRSRRPITDRVSRYGPLPTSNHARQAVRSVRWAAQALPARIACLEESTAASLLLMLGGRGGAWRHGLATDPIRLHAWICDLHGRPIDEPVHTDHYTPINAPESAWKKNR
ncbi:lasso peptide biosynthesis B2 protein [Streptomyces uncialis]|uniref:lasso peptide biosynthesis B2 protein n=1 Tax=Streptomyces uncialis TaxID=1048205 RepID=UPI00386AE857|nr:lasso peptide biosynthesis B2 protein [Streptomyces uncialis]